MPSNLGAIRRRLTSLSRVALCPMVLASCQIPEAPEWDVGLVIPFSVSPVSIIDLLPEAVDTATVAGEPAFRVDDLQDGLDYGLGQMCEACRGVHGLTVPVPGFDYADSLAVRFPGELVSIEIIEARLGAQFRNDLNFDPLRPHPDPDSAGYVAVALRDLGSGALLDSLFISGASETLPADSTWRLELNLSETELTEGVRAVFYLHSPEDGQLVQVDTSKRVNILSYLDQMIAAAVTVEVDSDTLEEDFPIDFEQDGRQEIADRVQSARLQLELLHDLEIEGVLDVSLAGSVSGLFSGTVGQEVRLESLTFDSGASQSRELTQEDMRTLASFPDPFFIGYRGIAVGTRQAPNGRSKLSRFTPVQQVEARFQLISDVRVGG